MDITGLIIGVAAFIAALLAAYYTWRSFHLQRVSSSPAGLQFMLGRVEATVKPRKSLLDEEIRKPSGTLVGVYARGPGVRYNVTPIVWSKASTMEISDSRTTWSAEDGPLEAELWFLNPKEKTHDTYFGVVWESPSAWTRNFVVRGYRVKLTWEDDKIMYNTFEVWSDRAEKWLYMPRVKEEKYDEGSPAYGSSKVGRDLRTQMEHRALDKRSDYPGTFRL